MSGAQRPPGWRSIPRGGVILEAGNSSKVWTGDWRSERPILYLDRCVHCMFCWLYCPDTSIQVSRGKVVGIDLDHCKGCGVCAEVCPVEAIKMVLEEVSVEED